MADKSEIEIFRTGSRAFLRVGSGNIEIDDYKISSSMRGGIELEVRIRLEDELTEFSSKASSKWHSTRNRLSRSSAP